MNIISVRTDYLAQVTYVLTEGCAEDVAAYRLPGLHTGQEAAAKGSKMTETEAIRAGLRWDSSKHYRR